jgi:hemoglobin-like flavoprotein
MRNRNRGRLEKGTIMTPRQIELVQSSFCLAQPILDDIVALFYDRLFELDPSLRRLFTSSRQEQTRKVAQALTLVVKSLARLEQIRAAIHALGVRHVAYGVRDEHYATVGAALLCALEAELDDAFTPEVREAWSAAYGWLAFTMQRAAAVSAPAPDTAALPARSRG